MKEIIARIERRDFLKMGAALSLGFIIPGVVSCSAQHHPDVGEKLSAVTLADLVGNKFTLPADLAGKIALIHFWASWCPTCRSEMTALEDVGKKYRGGGVVPYSIGIGEKRNSAYAYTKDLGITYPVLLDPQSVTQKQFGISGIPTYYILSRDGIIRYKIVGEANKNRWDTIIRALL